MRSLAPVVPVLASLAMLGCRPPAETAAPEEGQGAESEAVPSRARGVIGTRGTESRKGVRRTIAAKKPPRTDDGKPKASRAPSKEVTLTSASPTWVVPGGYVEVYGGPFDDAQKLKVFVGNKKWPVEMAAGDRMLVKVPADAKSGKLSIGRGRKEVAGPELTVLAANDGFAKAHTVPGHGLNARVFAMSGAPTELPSFDSLGEPLGSLRLNTVDVAPQTSAALGPAGTGPFAMHLQGSLNVVEAGDADLCIESDDGAQLYIEGELIVDNDGQHGPQSVCEALTLEAGEYGVDLLYFQAADDAVALRLTWKRGDTTEVIPAAALFPPQ